jgi:hypothetical protein
MADQKFIYTLLTQAKSQGFLRPSQEENICFHPSLNTANFFLYCLEQVGESGLDYEQMAQRSKLNFNTCKIFLRGLAVQKLAFAIDYSNATYNKRGRPLQVYFLNK